MCSAPNIKIPEPKTPEMLAPNAAASGSNLLLDMVSRRKGRGALRVNLATPSTGTGVSTGA